MLTVAKIKAQSATAYQQYLQSRAASGERGDYYLQDGNVVEAPGRWVTGPLGGAALGLQDGVMLEAEAFAAVMNGNHPQTGLALRRAGADSSRVVALDLTFSAPKSVSVAWAFADPQLRGQLEDALERAVDSAMTGAVARVPMVRQRIDGKIRHVTAGELITSSWRHTTARAVEGRAPDPQLHIHRLLHAAVRQDGQVAAVDSRSLLTHQRELGARFRSQLARELEQLGFAIQRETGRGARYFELAGVERPLIDAFSERHAQITERIAAAEQRRIGELQQTIGRARDTDLPVSERPDGQQAADALRELESLELHGRLSPGQERAEALRSRAAKGLVTRGDLEHAWWQTAAPHAFDTRTVTQLRELTRAAPDRGELATRIAARLTEFDATFTATHGRATALESAAGLGESSELGDELYDQLLADGIVIELAGGRQTTRMHRQMERATVRAADQLATSHATGPLSADSVSHEIDRIDTELRAIGAGLAPEQADAVRAACTQARLTVIEGQAGTGKSTALGAIGRVHQASGRNIIVTSTGGLAATRLGDELANAGVTTEAMTTEALRRRITDGRLALTDQTTVIHDEAALAATHEQHFLLRALADSPARLIAVGDGQQGQPVRAGGLWQRLSASAKRAGAHVELTTIVRARAQADRDTQVLWRRGAHRAAIADWAQRDRITITSRQQDAEQQALRAWHTDRKAGRDVAVMYAGSNDRVDELNARAQALRVAAGELGATGLALSRRPYELRAGDDVVLRAQAQHPQLGRVENGTPGRVVDVSDDQLLLALGDGRQAAWTGRQIDSADVRLAYVQHPWPAQGITVDQLHLIHDELSSARSTYVAATRPRDSFRIYAARETLDAIRDGRDDLSDHHVLAQSLGQTEPDAPSIDLRLLDVERPSPTTDPPQPSAPDEARTVSERADIVVDDPLDRIRAAVGPALAAGLHTPPDPRLQQLSSEALQRLIDEHQPAIDAFPGPQALELARITAQLREAEAARGHAQRDVADLQRDHDQLPRRRRDDRARLQDRITVRQRAVDTADRDITTLTARASDLAAGDRSPKAWIAQHAGAANQWAHAQRELAIRRELALRDAHQRAMTNPPPHVVTTLGQRPQDAPGRARYDQLAGDLERHRLEHHDTTTSRATPRTRSSDPERDALLQRVRDSRGERDLPRDPPSLEHAPDLAELDVADLDLGT